MTHPNSTETLTIGGQASCRGFAPGDVVEISGGTVDEPPRLRRIDAVPDALWFTCTPLGRWDAAHYRARRWLGRAWRRARAWVGMGLMAWGCQGCGLDVSAALASCASDLQCAPSELCSAGACALRCDGPGTCPEGFGCYLTYRERQGDPRGYYATCAPEQDGLRECPAVGAGGAGGGAGGGL